MSDNKTYLYLNHCPCCNVRLDTVNKSNIRAVTETTVEKLRVAFNDKVIKIGALVCKKCITKAGRKCQEQSPIIENVISDETTETNSLYSQIEPSSFEPSSVVDHNNNETQSTQSSSNSEIIVIKKSMIVESMLIDIPRTCASHQYCIVCRRDNCIKKLHLISTDAIIDVYFQRELLIPKGSRACGSHFDENGYLNSNSIYNLVAAESRTKLDATNIKNLFESFRLAKLNSSFFARFRDASTITNDLCLKKTGFSKEQFIEISESLTEMRNSAHRTIMQALAIYLFWLKTGLDQNTIASIFEIESHFEVKDYCDQVRDALIKNFVRNNIGPHIMNRTEWLKHNSFIPKSLFCENDNQFIVIADGTYCYIQKRKNNYFQRKTYSVQKHRHLVKPFIICATDGFIIDIYGLFPAVQNDASILLDVLKQHEELTSLIQQNDICILDRGFRDCIDDLKNDYALLTKMPACLKKKQKQLTVTEANESRYVTKCRWVVEVVNSHLKRSFRALDTVKNKSLTHIYNDYKIAGAFINRYFKRLFADNDNKERIVENMKKKREAENELENLVKNQKLNLKKKVFIMLDAVDIKDFPKIDKEILKEDIILGSYQLEQSIGYIAEHMSEGKYHIRASNEQEYLGKSKLLFALIQSRHSKSTRYKVYVKYNPNKETVNSIEGWYCTCKNGCRTNGCCSHVASIIYYFSYAKYLDFVSKPGEHLTTVFPTPVVFESTDNSDTDDESIKKKEKKVKNKKKMKTDTQKKDIDDADEIKMKSKRYRLVSSSDDETSKNVYRLKEQ